MLATLTGVMSMKFAQEHKLTPGQNPLHDAIISSQQDACIALIESRTMKAFLKKKLDISEEEFDSERIMQAILMTVQRKVPADTIALAIKQTAQNGSFDDE